MREAKLRKEYETIVEKYAKSFCKKHELDYSDGYWIGQDIGGVFGINDYFIDFDLIRFDLDLDAPVSCFFRYYWDRLEYHEYPNYQNWMKLSESQLIKIVKGLKKRTYLTTDT